MESRKTTGGGTTALTLWKDESGQGLTEYAVILSLIALAATASLTALGSKTNSDFEVMNDGISTEAAEEIYEYEETITPVGYYVSEWNTEPDGSGTSYTIRGTVKRLLASGKTLYPILSSNTYTVRFVSNGGTGTMQDQVFTYDQEQALAGNAFANEDYWFYGWNTLQAPSESSTGIFYRDGQSVKNLTTANNGVVYLFAQWKTYELVDDVINPEAQFDVVSMNMALEESIGLRLKLNNLSEPEHLERYHITASFGGATTVSGTLSEFLASGVATIRDGKYVVPVAYPTTKEMVDAVHICVSLDGGEGNSEVIEEFDYSVQTYCENMIVKNPNNANLVALCTATLDYGAYSQKQFNYKTNNLANANYTAGEDTIRDTVIHDQYDVTSVTGACTGIKSSGRSVNLITATELRFKFTPESGFTLGQFSFKVNGEAAEAVMDAGKFMVAVGGIGAPDLNDTYTVVITNKDDNTTMTVKYSALSYACRMQNNSSETVAMMCKALYLYYVAAKAYFR